MSRLITLAVTIALIGCTAGRAAADTGGSASTDQTGIHSGARADSNQPGAASGSRPICVYQPIDIPAGMTVYNEDTGAAIQTDGTGGWYQKTCDGVFFGAIYVSRRNPTQLIEEARRYLPLPAPAVELNPSGDQIVNLATWMWLTDGWAPERSSVAVPGITVTVDATPVSTIWSMGDGSEVVCAGPGNRYDPSLPASAQTPTCTYTYARSSAAQPGDAYAVSVTVRWQATWAVSGGVGGGNLATIDRTSTLSVRVGEVQAVNTATN